MWKLTLATLVLPVVGATGCFYVDTINQRPSVQIRQEDGQVVLVDVPVTLTAQAEDPEGGAIALTWRAYACDETGVIVNCMFTPLNTGADTTFDVTAPATYTSAGVELPTESLLIILEAKDERGATADPRAQLILPVIDKEPTIVLRQFSRYESAVNTPVELFALVEDDDDAPADVEVTWTLIESPVGSTIALAPADPEIVDIPDEPSQRQHGKVFSANTPGRYTYRVTAADPRGRDCLAQDPPETCNIGEETINIEVGEDRAPCIAQTTPAASPAGASIPVTEATLFRVPFVSDDLDGFPIVPNDPIAGAPTFAWSLKAPGQPSYVTQAGVTGNNIAFDPASYALGDVVDIRVEIKDRKLTAVNCPAGDLFCSTISSPTCVQRVTWRVEVR
jgi:hypothetical protein